MENIPLPGMPPESKPKVCKDCVAVATAWDEWNVNATPRDYVERIGEPERPSKTLRKAPHPGPRCTTHHRQFKRGSKAKNHETYVAKTYGMQPGEYDSLKELQGGLCAICRRATGATRALSVDHDHACCDGPVSCGDCIRGLLCRPCNDILGHARDNPDYFMRFVAYLVSPPYKALIRKQALELLNEKG